MSRKKIEQLAITRYAGAQAVQFNPAKYKTAFQQYTQGVYGELVAMMTAAEADGHTAGCIEGRISGFQKSFAFTPYDETNDQDRKRAEWFNDVFKDLDVYNLLIDIWEARLKIFSVVEFGWDIVDGFLAPVSHKKWEQKYFRWDDKTEMFVVESKGAVLIPDACLVSYYRRKPIMLSVLRDYILKEFGLNSWAAFMETWGEPLLIGRYPAGAQNSTLRTELDEALASIARSSRGTLPKSADIEIKETSRTTGDHDRFIEMCDQSISIVTLGHANAVESSKGLQVGENLTQYQVRRDLAVSDMLFIDSQISRLVRFIYRLNWTDNRYPYFSLDKTPPLDVKDFRETLDRAYNWGYPIHPEDVRKLGVRVEPDEEPHSKPPSLLDIGD